MSWIFNIMKIAILGAGGLGKAAAHIISQKTDMQLVAIADAGGFVFNQSGIDADELQEIKVGGSVSSMKNGQRSQDAIGEIINLKAEYDGVFIALPNLPNDFIPCVVQRFVAGGFQGALVDALKRTQAMEMIFGLDALLQDSKCTYLSGCGATPGLLTAAAAIAAQSFAKVEKVHIWWGVGIARWDDYKATIREDIAHLPGYDVDSAKTLSDAEVEAILGATDGKLTLYNMEHADDVMLERAGVCERSQVTVGGVMDTRNAQKPVSTTMTLTGITFDGKRSEHKFILGDETSMAANVCGTALGYLNRAHWLRGRGVFGVFGSAEMMPLTVK
ncbi:Glutamate/Leucine/Phenylalanine/Valine dehydrogenase [Abditibacterium utsteinense]|uniref:Glutamate/Leucine/Phenylalanine/Valine dehydrogenase n=2 Tax=Abditibacterium utsteinense TaxID=1960156 RepID=A0A2S8SSD5_9BACT|nr:Glutamate/Leucine/Phenylalanine/Valine dehydrogenase [Abditibacterium utsteinense]